MANAFVGVFSATLLFIVVKAMYRVSSLFLLFTEEVLSMVTAKHST